MTAVGSAASPLIQRSPFTQYNSFDDVGNRLLALHVRAIERPGTGPEILARSKFLNCDDLAVANSFATTATPRPAGMLDLSGLAQATQARVLDFSRRAHSIIHNLLAEWTFGVPDIDSNSIPARSNRLFRRSFSPQIKLGELPVLAR